MGRAGPLANPTAIALPVLHMYVMARRRRASLAMENTAPACYTCPITFFLLRLKVLSCAVQKGVHRQIYLRTFISGSS